jgi:hypothetical protein
MNTPKPRHPSHGSHPSLRPPGHPIWIAVWNEGVPFRPVIVKVIEQLFRGRLFNDHCHPLEEAPMQNQV